VENEHAVILRVPGGAADHQIFSQYDGANHQSHRPLYQIGNQA
jgi:hypothetical protein